MVIKKRLSENYKPVIQFFLRRPLEFTKCASSENFFLEQGETISCIPQSQWRIENQGQIL